jgi:hypothetical protein
MGGEQKCGGGEDETGERGVKAVQRGEFHKGGDGKIGI